MAGIQRKGGRYYAIFKDAAGKKVVRAVKGRTLTEARKNARDLEERAWRTRNNLGTEPTLETLAEVAPRFLKASRHQSSFNSLESRWRLHIVPALGALPVGQIRPTHIDELLATKLDEGYGQQTRRHLRMTLSAFFKWAVKDGLVERNPVREVEAIAVPDAEPKALTWSQLEALRDAVELPWLKDLIWVAAHLALRYCELRRMKWTHVDFGNGIIATKRAKRSTTQQRTEVSRPAVIPDVLLPYLRAMWVRRRGEYLFCYEDGGHYRRRALTPVSRQPSRPRRSSGATNSFAAVGGVVSVSPRRAAGPRRVRDAASPSGRRSSRAPSPSRIFGAAPSPASST